MVEQGERLEGGRGLGTLGDGECTVGLVEARAFW